MSSTDDFTHASQAFVDVVEGIGPDQWELPGLGNWDVRALVGHTARAILTVENYLALDEPGHVSVPTAVRYYATVYSDYTDPKAIEERGVEAGVWLGDEPATTIRDARIRARAAIDAQHPDRIVSIGGLGVPLGEYLRTRVFELVVHTIDISRATGVEHHISTAALAHTVALAGEIAVEAGRGDDLLLAMTGRAPLPEDFTIV